MKKSRVRLGQLTIIAASIHLMFGEAPALANPTGPQVVSGSATVQRPDPATLNVTNSPGTIINWQGFSIGASEVTRFIQQSSSSAVLNRVVGPDISQIHGQLLSNGRVFLINPSGIVVGPGAIVDTAGFVASTLNMLDGDFLAGKLKFQGDASSGSIINQGWIRTGYGGQVILVAPQIENSGLIHTPGGEIILAAGKSLTITSLDLEGVQFEVQAPTDSVLNVGKLLADGGAVGVFAGTLRHSGEIRANALVRDEGGQIVLKAQSDIQIAAGSTTAADGKVGGSITIQSSEGHTRVAGKVTAKGSDGQGGDVRLLGDRVSVVESAVVDASGSAGGGQILVGGDFQGNNPDVQNSINTFVGAAATLRADATRSGDGGRIIVWSDDKAQFYGSLSAQGGPDGGNGGFAEVSGKQNLIFAGSANLGAPKGSMGTLLLDPLDLFVFAGGGLDPTIINESTDFPSNAATVSPETLEAINGNVTLFASRYMRISDPIDFSATPGKGLTAQVGTYTAPALPDPLALSTGTISNELEIGADITTAGGAVSLSAPTIQSVAASTISTAGGTITLDSSGSTIQASSLSLDAGSGAVIATSGSFLQLGAVAGGSFTAMAPSFITTGAITTSGGPVNLTSTGSSVNTGNITAGGGTVSLTGNGGVSTGTVNTSGSVVLSASSGSISSTVNNASSLTANAAFGAFINSTTNINVDTVNAGSFGTASLSTSGGSILATSSSSQVKGFDVALSSTDTGTGGGIGTAGTALNVDVQRDLSFTTNAAFNVLLNGTGPNRQLLIDLNPAHSTTGSYVGAMSKSGGGLTLNASADTSTVTLDTLNVAGGFDQFSSFIRFRVPSGNLVANTVMVPVGNTTFASQLPVELRASGNLTLGDYTRSSGGLLNTTTITSTGGTVTLGNVNAGNDTVNVTGPSGITVSSLISTGNITLISSAGAVNALADNVGVEITSNGTLSITGRGIGTAAFGNPLDLAAAIILLTSTGGAAGPIGGASPVIANTQNLTINAGSGSTFNVSTGSTDIINLTVTASPSAVAGGSAQVSSNGAVYNFNNDVDNTRFTFDLNGGTIQAGHFANGTLNFTSTSGDINLVGNTNLGAGSLVLTTNGAAIDSGGASITAASVSLTANNTIDTDTGAITATSGGIVLRANTGITAGDLNAPGLIDINRRSGSGFPVVMVGDIGNLTAPQTLAIFGSTVDTGAITGAGNITIGANTGLLTLGGAVATADGSTINLSSGGATPFSFTSIDAGIAGTVIINSANGITQQSGGTGIKAQTIGLFASGGDILGLDTLPGGNHLDLLNGTNSLNLTVDAGGNALLDANGNTLSSLTLTKRTIPDVDSFNLLNQAIGQSIAIGGGASELEVDISSSSPLNLALTYTTGDAINLVGGGIVTGGGSVSLTSSGGINATTGGITTSGGNVQLTTFGGGVTTGAIDTSGSGGSIQINTFSANGHIDISGNLTTGTGGAAIGLNAFSGGNITRSGVFSLNSDSSVSITTSNGEIGASGTPLLITSPSVTLNANRGGAAAANEGLVTATLTGTSALDLTGALGFDVSSDTDLSTLSVSTRGSGTGAVTLTTPGQIYSFARPANDLFGAVTNTFQVSGVSGTALTNATFSVSDGTLLVTGPGINATNLTLSSTNGADISLQGTAANPLNLSNTTQALSATGGGAADILIRGKVTLDANTSQTFFSTGNINVSAEAGGGGGVTITAPNQTFTTSGSASKIELLGGAAAGESVTVTATNQQTISATTASNSPDSLRLKGGAGAGSSVALSYSGSGIQEIYVRNGTVTVEGGDGLNAFAKIESTSTNQQQIGCPSGSTFIGCGNPIGTLNILGGNGDGAFAQITAGGSQIVRVTNATTVRAGAGSGANALLQAATTQQITGNGDLTVEGMGSPGKTAKAEVLASGFQTLNVDDILVKGGVETGSLARIATSGTQSISADDITVSAGGAGQTAEPFVAVPGASAIIEGHSQNISFDNMTLNGGAGAAGNTSDALVRNLSGNQSLFGSGSVTLNGGHTESTTGILNLGSGTQTVTGSGGILLRSDPSLPPAHADSFVLIENQAATTQTITASSGGVTLLNSGHGTVALTSAGSQSVTSRFVDVSTAAGSTGNATLSATGNQRIHTTNGTFGPNGSMRVAALGTGTASITSGASQLLELDYPEQMQFVRDGRLTIGDANAVGNSLIQAVDQSVFARSILIEGGTGAGSTSKLGASNTQTITTLQGGIELIGGDGANSLATIDPLTQTILSNGGISLLGGSGVNADASILSAGAQIILSTNGDIVLEGGTGVGADAFITGLGFPQIISTTGSIILAPDAGDAFISGPPSLQLFPFAPIFQVLVEQEYQTSTLDQIIAWMEEPIDTRRRAPICR